jgi:HTH-type transcriptional regulator/antitoxin HipB
MDTLLLQLPSQLGPHLLSLRRAREITQRVLAARLGVTQARIAAIEGNPGAVSMNQLMAILSALGVDLLLRPRSSRDTVATGTPPT